MLNKMNGTSGLDGLRHPFGKTWEETMGEQVKQKKQELDDDYLIPSAKFPQIQPSVEILLEGARKNRESLQTAQKQAGANGKVFGISWVGEPKWYSEAKLEDLKRGKLQFHFEPSCLGIDIVPVDWWYSSSRGPRH